YFDLAQQRHDLLRTKPLLCHDKAPFQVSFYRTAWFKKSRSGQGLQTACLGRRILKITEPEAAKHWAESKICGLRFLDNL
ncbi:MAG: hypothetical protein ACXWLK_08265, partial [Rhizomicrobium sp.]